MERVEVKKAFVMWQDGETRRWHTVGCLGYDGKEYSFYYTKGAQKSQHFTPFGRMDALDEIYKSEDLFPLFANRVLSKSRPEYEEFIAWMGLEGQNIHPFQLLVRAEGLKETDRLIVHACPERGDDDKYTNFLFCHGIRYLARAEGEYLDARVKAGDNVFPMLDMLNKADPKAIALRTDDPILMIGYAPRYLAEDISFLAKKSHQSFSITVEKFNLDAPVQYRILCKVTCDWPQDFIPCNSDEYLPIKL